jgi:hypothetical protein
MRAWPGSKSRFGSPDIVVVIFVGMAAAFLIAGAWSNGGHSALSWKARWAVFQEKFSSDSAKEARIQQIKYADLKNRADLMLAFERSSVRVVHGGNWEDWNQCEQFTNTLESYTKMVAPLSRNHRELALVLVHGGFVETGLSTTGEEGLWTTTELLKAVGFQTVAYAVSSHGMWMQWRITSMGFRRGWKSKSER